MRPDTFIQFERGDKVWLKGSRVTYTVIRVDVRNAHKYDPDIADALITGGGVDRMVPVSQLELVT